MNKNLIKKTLVFGIVILFMGTIITPSISGNDSKMNDVTSVKTKDFNNFVQNKGRDPHTTSTTDWWPMFRHDSGNTGSTTSIAPSTDILCWQETVPEEFFLTSPIVHNDRLFISTGGFYAGLEPPIIIEELLSNPPEYTEFLDDLLTYKDEYYGGLYCFDADTGNQLWDKQLYAPNDPLVVNDKVYLTDSGYYYSDSTLYCLEAENGNLIWGKPVGAVVTTPTIGCDDKIIFGGIDYFSFGGVVKCYNMDGTESWSYNLPGYELTLFSAPACCDGKVYFVSVDLYSYFMGKLYCLDAETGEYLWWEPISTYWIFSPSPACKDGKVYLVETSFYYYGYGTYLKCFDADTGNLLWKYDLGFALSFASTPAVTQDSVFTAAVEYYPLSSYLYRISTDGALIWKAITPGFAYFFSSSTPTCSANKVIICPMDDYYYGYGTTICCYEIDNGNMLWSHALPSDLFSLVYPSIAEERVYTADSYGNIYAFEDVLKINKISGGILRVRAVIKNNGAADLTNVSWSIDVVGGMINMVDKHAEGNIPTLKGDKSKTVRAFPVIGFGNVEIEVSVSMPGQTPIRKNLDGLVLGLIVIVKS